MANLIVKNDANAFTSVFQPIQINYQWENPLCTVYNSGGSLGIQANVDFLSDISVGSFVQILNGSYKGTYRVSSFTSDVSFVYIVTDGTFVSLDSTSNLFNVDTRQLFSLFAGYQSGNGATIKPYIKIATISVPINTNTALFEVDVQSYLRSYFQINAPVVGKDYGLSLQWELIPETGEATTASTIDWELDEQVGVDGAIIINEDGSQEVLQLSSATGTLNQESGETVFVECYLNSAGLNQSLTNEINLTVVNTTTASTLIDETETITNFASPEVGRISFGFTIAVDGDYTITVTTTAS